MEFNNEVRDHHDEHKKNEQVDYDYEKMGGFMSPQAQMGGYNQMQGCPVHGCPMYGNPMYCPMFQNQSYGSAMPNMPYKVRDDDDFDRRPYSPPYYSNPNYYPYYHNPYFYPRPHQYPYFFPFFW